MSLLLCIFKYTFHIKLYIALELKEKYFNIATTQNTVHRECLNTPLCASNKKSVSFSVHVYCYFKHIRLLYNCVFKKKTRLFHTIDIMFLLRSERSYSNVISFSQQHFYVFSSAHFTLKLYISLELGEKYFNIDGTQHIVNS